MDGSKDQPKTTAGLDLGDKYSYLCLIDQHSGEVIEEGRLRTSPETFKRRFASERPMRIAIEAGTHSPWASRVLEECGHEVLVANARKLRLIYANARKTHEIDAENLARLAPKGAGSIPVGHPLTSHIGKPNARQSLGPRSITESFLTPPSLRHSERMTRRLYSCYGSFERDRMDLWLLKPGHKLRTRDGAGAGRAGSS
jgi:hypothetical protein